MENQTNEVKEEELHPDLCSNCQQNKYEVNYTFKLCTECRTSLVNFPIPKWIYLAAAFLLVTIILGIAETSGNFMAAVHLSRGQKAVEEHRYKTAEKELEKTLESVPNSLLANVQLMMVYAYTFNTEKLIPLYKKIGEQRVEDKELFDKSTDALNYYGSMYPVDTLFYANLQTAGNSVPLIENVLDSNKKYFPYDHGSAYMAADRLFELDEYGKSQRILFDILKEKEDFRPALQLLAAIKRNEKNCDSAIFYCDRLLTYNLEDESVIAQKAKIELKRKNDKLAAEYVRMAMDLDSTSVYSLEAKAMLQYFSNDKAGSKITLNKIIAMESEGNNGISDRISKIFTGKEIYR